jgi:hypothetical protein
VLLILVAFPRQPTQAAGTANNVLRNADASEGPQYWNAGETQRSKKSRGTHVSCFGEEAGLLRRYPSARGMKTCTSSSLKGVPYSGAAARFDDLALYVVTNEAAARTIAARRVTDARIKVAAVTYPVKRSPR